MTNFVPPGQQRNLRACMRFAGQGCPNCDDFLNLRGSLETVQECTSQVFEGLITLADPQASWVAKWQRLDAYVPGVYAVKVVGVLPSYVLDRMEDNGINYIPRDGTSAEEQGMMEE